MSSIAYASENDDNLCYDGNAWEGQCTTQRDWEAGWCYANQDAAVCDSLYGDGASQAEASEVQQQSQKSKAASQPAQAAESNVIGGGQICQAGFACAASGVLR